MGSFVITPDRKERMDFMFPSWSEGFGLVVPSPEEESRLFAFIRPFQPMVWLLIFNSVILVVFMMTFLAWFYYGYGKKHGNTSNMTNQIKMYKGNCIDENLHHGNKSRVLFDSFIYNLIYVINILTNQGGTERFDRHSFRVLAGFWLLAGMVLVNSYAGIVISSLTVPKMKSIDSLEDLAVNKKVDVILRSDTPIGEQILKATSGLYKVIGDRARSKPDQIFTDPFKLNAALATGRYAYPFMQTFCFSFVATQYKKDGKCRFKVTKLPKLSAGYYQHPVKKGSPYAHMFDKTLMEASERGLVRFWVKEISPRTEICNPTNSQKKSARQVPIYLTDLISAFFILSTGLGMATLAFILELLLEKCHTARKVDLVEASKIDQ